MAREVQDCIVVGAGPAGLSAAIYLGRFLCKTVVIQGPGGRAQGPQLNENYFGFPRGVKAEKLCQLGTAQARRFKVGFVSGTVAQASIKDGKFVLAGDCGTWHARTLILATGVTDVWPSFPNAEKHIGKSLFWCITCDGFRTKGKKLVLVGADEESTTTALQFLAFTDDILFVAESVEGKNAIPDEQVELMTKKGIRVVEGRLDRLVGRPGRITAAVVDGERHPAQIVFSLLGAVPNSQLAAQLGALIDEKGYVNITIEQRTNVPRLYAAGDVSGPYAHQVSSAVHEGAMAGQAANFDLYAEFQRG
ncbi:MAG: NAD(P)/FAD-dependent oxidoreductase [Dehalococcoidia bacterium]